MKYRLAAFDFDGTLADSFGWLAGAMAEIAGRHGFRRLPPAEVEAVRGWDVRAALRHVGLPAWRVPRLMADVRRLQARDIDRIKLFPGADAMLAGLADRGVVLAVVSSNAEENVRRVLGDRTAALVGHYRCGASLFGKPRKLRAVLRAAGASAAEAIYVGDEGRDVEAARRVGMAAGVVSWGYATTAALREQSPTEVFATMDEIVARVG